MGLGEFLRNVCMVGRDVWAQMQEETRQRYAADGIRLTEQQVRQETVADWVGKNLFKSGFAQAVVNGDANTGNAFIRTLDRVRRALTGKKNNPSAGDIAMLERLFMQAVENKLGAREGEGQYSIRQTSTMPYLEQLALVETGKLNGSNSIYIGHALAMETAGFANAPFVMNQGDYRKSRRSQGNNKHYSSHAVSYEFFKNLPKSLNDAPMLIDNGKKVTVITSDSMKDTKGANSYIIAGVLRNETMEGEDIHQIKSVYPLDDFAIQVKAAAESGRLVIINKNKAKQMLSTIGVQPSELTSIVDLAKGSLSQLAQNVNTQNALLQGEKFTGDAMTPEARARWMGTPSVAEGDTSFQEGGLNQHHIQKMKTLHTLSSG